MTKEDKPTSRPLPDNKPVITSMGGGEPEKRFTPVPPSSPTPTPRPIPDNKPAVTTMGGGEPEKRFTPS